MMESRINESGISCNLKGKDVFGSGRLTNLDKMNVYFNTSQRFMLIRKILRNNNMLLV